jgi:hypothetical protein
MVLVGCDWAMALDPRLERSRGLMPSSSGLWRYGQRQ